MMRRLGILIIGLLVLLLLIQPAWSTSTNKDTRATYTESAWPCYKGNYRRTCESDISVEMNTGDLLWEFRPDYKNEEYYESIHGFAIDGYGQLVMSRSEKFYAFNQSGDIVWELNTPGKATHGPAMDIYGNSYALTSSDNGRVIYMNAVGMERWSSSLSDMICGVPAVTADSKVIFGTTEGMIYCRNHVSSEVWSTQIEEFNEFHACYPSLSPTGSIIITYISDTFSVGKITSLSQDGEFEWHKSFAIEGLPVISSDGTVIVPYSENHLYSGPTMLFAFNPNGSVKWERSYDFEISPWSLSMYQDEYMVLGTEDGQIVALDLDGRELWREVLWGEIQAPITFSSEGSMIIAANHEDFEIAESKIYLLEKDRTVRWTYEIDDGRIDEPIAIGPNGAIYAIVESEYGTQYDDNSLIVLGNESMLPEDPVVNDNEGDGESNDFDPLVLIISVSFCTFVLIITIIIAVVIIIGKRR